ncbi:nucleoside hydrolase [Frigidibacter sp. ROC022]|uniref:nucleoside hydrolase n=1 Tax=Frigidibacter sp. ROC022 TaxID=2971796 RepID=UPI00215B279D|nr:nucleoside hydrolase [Frigidibacter sp. ROC022]MCR8722862.1 nucleoside hydrolase [Frigidibacter sp. ROC022]
MRKLLIDTDPGIDDAIALLFALNAAGLDVSAITTVAGNIGLETTTRNALRVLAVGGQEVPVIPGAAAPLHRPGIRELAVHGADGLGGVALPEPLAVPQHGDAVGYLADLLMQHGPDTHDLLALGPLTNLAGLIREVPGAARRLGQVIAMGGALEEAGNVGPHSEFNFANDPEAVEIVLTAGLDLTLIPLDVTRKLRADAAFMDRLTRAGTPQALAVRDLIGAYFVPSAAGAAPPTSRPLHDLCVPVLALVPDFFDVVPAQFGVDCSQGPDAGALVPGIHKVKTAVGNRAGAVLDLVVEEMC